MAARLIDSSMPAIPQASNATGLPATLVTHSNYQMQPRQRRNVALTLLQVQAVKRERERVWGKAVSEALPPFKSSLEARARAKRVFSCVCKSQESRESC